MLLLTPEQGGATPKYQDVDSSLRDVEWPECESALGKTFGTTRGFFRAGRFWGEMVCAARFHGVRAPSLKDVVLGCSERLNFYPCTECGD